MGRLITKTDLFETFDRRKYRIDACWYLSDAQPHYTSDDYSYHWPNKSYPHIITIPTDKLKDNNTKIRIRQWIEINLSETVITDRDTYLKEYKFYFDNSHSALIFSIAFGDLIMAENKSATLLDHQWVG